MKKILLASLMITILSFVGTSFAADVVPPVIDLPGTQPKEVGNFDNPGRCDNCHGGYDQSTYSQAPAFGWKGSAMGNAGRDPIFWATLAIAEQDFDGAGDLCIRCHSAGGWIASRSTPTDGSGLQTGDEHGIDCDTCHKSTNPDNSEHLGVMNWPFVANDPFTGEGYYGSGILSLWGSNDKLGPYDPQDAQAKHQRAKSAFHRSEDFCGTCHDVSNSAVGHYAPNHGAQPGAVANVITDGPKTNPRYDNILQASNVPYVGLNNPPYAYGIVERTYSEYKSSKFSGMPISKFTNPAPDDPDPLPDDLKVSGGALELAANAAGAFYDDGDPRYFTCQSCHMKATTGIGANKAGTPTRNDLPMHDLTGGNHWVYPLIKYQDHQGTLRMGGGLDATQIAAMDAGVIRAEDSLRSTISLEVIGNTVKLTNLTGHKAITGYPEGRRMWLNIKWYNGDALIREDGKYGPLRGVSVTYQATDGREVTFQPESILDLNGTNTKIYEAHYGMTKDWAALLVSLGYPTNLVLSYDRLTGDPDYTLGDLASAPPGTHHETFHFAINNDVIKDNRIPPYGMSYDKAEKRNALPVPPDQYGDPGPGGVYDYHDVVNLTPPTNPSATHAEITLYYQGTSWEYIQFLWLANNTPAGQFLADEGVNMLDAWVKAVDKNGNKMVKPFAMATATWGTPVCTPTEPTEVTCDDGLDNDCDGLIDGDDPDCPAPPACDNNGICEPGEDCQSCANDCAGKLSGKPASRFCCGDGIPQSAEGDGTICDGNF